MVSQGKVSEFAKLREKTMTLAQGETVILDWCQQLHPMMIFEFEHILSRNKNIPFHKAKQFESPPFFETWGSRGNTWQVSEVSSTDIEISDKCVDLYIIWFDSFSGKETSRAKILGLYKFWSILFDVLIPITCFLPKARQVVATVPPAPLPSRWPCNWEIHMKVRIMISGWMTTQKKATSVDFNLILAQMQLVILWWFKSSNELGSQQSWVVYIKLPSQNTGPFISIPPFPWAEPGKFENFILPKRQIIVIFSLKIDLPSLCHFCP